MTMKHLMIALLAVACIGSQAFAAEASSELNVDDSFPIIFYGLKTNDQALATAKEWGATYVHRYGSGRYIERDQTFFDMAEKHGLKVMADLRARYWLKDENSLKGLRKYVNHFKDHPALGFWYLCDEPDLRDYSVAQLKPLYDLVKKQSPDVPIAIANAWSEHWYKYGEVEDILMYDYYPIDAQSFPNVKHLGSWTNLTQSAYKRGRKDDDAVIPIIQMFNWAAMADEGDKTQHGQPLDELRHPNATEMRYMTFTPMAMGAPGLSFWSYSRARDLDPDWGGRVVAPIIHEAKKFARQIRGAKMRRVRRAEDEDLFVTLWNGDQGAYMMLVNAGSNARSINRSLGGELESGTLEPWGKTREAEATLKNGRVRIPEAKPWEILIWRIQNPR